MEVVFTLDPQDQVIRQEVFWNAGKELADIALFTNQTSKKQTNKNRQETTMLGLFLSPPSFHTTLWCKIELTNPSSVYRRHET